MQPNQFTYQADLGPPAGQHERLRQEQFSSVATRRKYLLPGRSKGQKIFFVKHLFGDLYSLCTAILSADNHSAHEMD